VDAIWYLLSQSGEGTSPAHLAHFVVPQNQDHGYDQEGLQWDWEQLQREILCPVKGKGVEKSWTPVEEKSSSGFSGSLDKLCAVLTALLQFPLSLPGPKVAFMSLPLPWDTTSGDKNPAVSLCQSYLPFAHEQVEVKCHVLILAIICSVLLTRLTFPLHREVLPPWALLSLLSSGQGSVTGPALPAVGSDCVAWKTTQQLFSCPLWGQMPLRIKVQVLHSVLTLPLEQSQEKCKGVFKGAS